MKKRNMIKKGLAVAVYRYNSTSSGTADIPVRR